MIRSKSRLSGQGVQQYWTASKCRLDRWSRNLKSFASDASQLDATAVRVQWPFVRGVLEEILTGEVLTRVWTAVLCLYDRQHGATEFESLGRSIMRQKTRSVQHRGRWTLWHTLATQLCSVGWRRSPSTARSDWQGTPHVPLPTLAFASVWQSYPRRWTRWLGSQT